MIETIVDQEQAVGGLRSDARLSGWKAELRDDLDETLATGAGRWSRAIAAVAWIHLTAFLICQALHDPAMRSDPRLLLVWAGELAAVLATLRAIVGPGWARSSPAIGVVTRLWGTFLILSFNLVMLNAHGRLGIAVVQAGLGDVEHILPGVAGLVVLAPAVHPGGADVLHSPA